MTLSLSKEGNRLQVDLQDWAGNSDDFVIGFSMKLSIVKDDHSWYIDFPEYSGDRSDLQLLAGADRLCEWFAQGRDKITIDLFASNSMHSKDGYLCLKKNFLEYDGCTYDIIDDPSNVLNLWITGETASVFGGWFPKYIYIKPV